MEEYIVKVYSDKTEWYNKERYLHRLDGPAREWSSGSKDWFQNGERHRLDGPAVEWSNGFKAWYQNGKLHREDGPAAEYSDGDKAWWQNGKRHRLDGPAIECSDGTKEWWIEGNEYTEEEFLRKTQPATELTVEEIAKRLGVSNLKIIKG